jgi:hypothetical protein
MLETAMLRLKGWGSVEMASELTTVLDVTIFTECKLESFVACSSRRGDEKAEAASWVHAVPGSSVQAYANICRLSVDCEDAHRLLHVKAFVLVHPPEFHSHEGSGQVTVAPLRLAIVQTSEDWRLVDSAGTPVYEVHPCASNSKSLHVVEVSRMKAPCIYVRPSESSNRQQMLRLIPFVAQGLS